MKATLPSKVLDDLAEIDFGDLNLDPAAAELLAAEFVRRMDAMPDALDAVGRAWGERAKHDRTLTVGQLEDEMEAAAELYARSCFEWLQAAALAQAPGRPQ
jgi:hypothetical protein